MQAANLTMYGVVAFAVAVIGGGEASAESAEAQRVVHVDFAREYTHDCVDGGTDQRVCACAVDHLMHERVRVSTPSVDAAPPGWKASVQPIDIRYRSYVAMCTRGAIALGMLGN